MSWLKRYAVFIWLGAALNVLAGLNYTNWKTYVFIIVSGFLIELRESVK